MCCATSSGINQVSGILPLIEKYEISDKIFHVNIDNDITASNTGKWAGSATILQKHIHSAYVWFIRRHHIVEKLVRHGLDAIRGATTSPFEIEHNQFQKNWNSLCQKIHVKSCTCNNHGSSAEGSPKFLQSCP